MSEKASKIPGLMVAGTHSGVGKTTITLALMAALRRRGLRVAPFKIGPDFIDPGLHALAAGNASRNLDGWMLGRRTSAVIFERACRGNDIAIVEGMMGLFDGASGHSEQGSAAEMAKWLGLPVMLVVDAWALARSAAAMVKGYAEFDPALRLTGVVFNRIGGTGHLEYLRDAMAAVPSVPLLGGLVRQEDLAIPERHLGLHTAEEGALDERRLDVLVRWFEAGVDMEALLTRLGASGADVRAPTRVDQSPASSKALRIKIAVARDEAFCFYYPDNLELLERAGATVAFFSPLRDKVLPDGTDLVYLGGGYPELHAARLADNRPMARALAQHVRAGGFIYAECGGFMYLCRELTDLEGRRYRMAGLLPFATRMKQRLAALGYREVEAVAGNPLFPPGARMRGHVFHHSELVDPLEEGRSNMGGSTMPTAAYRIVGPGTMKPDAEGFSHGRIVGGYLHLHFLSNPDALVDAMRRVAAAR